jgi:alpha-tubulin suppressor-like RCC1 family protein
MLLNATSSRRLFPAASLTALTALLLAGCSDDRPLGPENERLYAISDGGHDGNEHFFFMRPLVPELTYTGDFDPTYAAEVRVCEWDGAACVGTDIANFTTSTGTGSEIIRIDPIAEHYIVNWHTNRANDGAGLDPTKTYRIIVSSDGYQLGFADVDVVSTGKELKNVNTDEYVALKDGVTLPIKFRIETGAVPAADKATVAAGFYHSCALNGSGFAYCWGLNQHGQLGTGSFSPFYSTTPLAVTGGHQFEEVHTMAYGTCGLKADGSVWCWGYNYYWSSPVPAQVAGGQVFTTLTAGYYHVCGIVQNGDVYCWGYGSHGQLGNGSFASSPAPVLVTGNHTFASIDAGHFHTCGLTVGGQALCWGYNWYGQLGRWFLTQASPPYGFNTPAAAMSAYTFAELSAGGYHTCGVTTGGATYCTGFNYHGQLGGGFTNTSYPYASTGAVAVQGGHVFASLSGGAEHTCAINGAGGAYCWGRNYEGQLGTGGASAPHATPQAVAGTDLWEQLSANYYHTCGRTDGALVRCWGYNYYGQVGSGGLSYSVAAPSGVTIP